NIFRAILKIYFMMRALTLFLLLFQFSFLKAQIIPSPKDHFGFTIGDDYQLTNYTQTAAYFKKLAAASDRVQLSDIGKTEEGRTQYMLIVSSPENLKRLEHYKQISQRLARAENLTEEQAKALAAEGKAVVWIDGGLHATETVGIHQLIETAYQIISRNDAETKRILDNTIILFVHANPDGQELVSNWYMQEKDVKKRNLNIPRLYQKYIGHDNNRDFLMMNMKESQNIARQQYLEWMPQIIYNHHQSGPVGSVVAGPPYRDPFNYVYDPLLITSIDAVGAAMQNRLNREDKPGFTSKSGSVFSTWWNGGLRTTAYYHNMVGLLTEIIGNPTPSRVPLVPSRLIPNSGTPNPVTPQAWHFKQSIDYSVSLNYAVLNYAVNQKEDLLYGIYHMGKNSIERGSRDNWTLSPKYIDSINTAYNNDRAKSTGQNAGSRTSDTIPVKYFNAVLKDPNHRDPRGYIIPANQPDFPTAVKFINTLIKSGILVHKATSNFTVAGKRYPSGSYIVKAAQAFRPHVLDMFEPQDHPNDFAYPGGPPVRPYDAAGWTIAYSMGVVFDRLLNDFTGPFERVPYGELQSVKGTVSKPVAGYILDAHVNNSFIVVNELLKAGVEVLRVPNKITGTNVSQGSFFIPPSAKAKEILNRSAIENGLNVSTTSQKPAGAIKIAPLRIALWDTYGGSMSSGWVRWIMEQYKFPFQVVYSKEIDAGDLRKKYDLILFVPGAIPSVNASGGGRTQRAEDLPAAYRYMVGRISADTSIPQLKRFLEAGGDIVTLGSSTNLAYHLNLPVTNALVEMTANNQERPLPGEKYYIPGSILRMKVDSTHSAAWGMNDETDVYFNASPVFKLTPEAVVNGNVKPLAWFATDKPLRSGWAWGQGYLKDGVSAFVAPVGKGKLYAFGPEITFRGQTHGTYKLLFNQLYTTR
ncbi:MAG TPA: M14 metallopeptidase family protein, partial [Flavisolibacter sp.]|nr:M14 metallopeptidase family protein [Flavisolibacter sp.]